MDEAIIINDKITNNDNTHHTQRHKKQRRKKGILVEKTMKERRFIL